MKILQLVLATAFVSCGDLTEVGNKRSVIMQGGGQSAENQEELRVNISGAQNLTLINQSQNEFKLANLVQKPILVFLLSDQDCSDCMSEASIEARQMLKDSRSCQLFEVLERPLYRDRPEAQNGRYASNVYMEAFVKRFGLEGDVRFFLRTVDGTNLHESQGFDSEAMLRHCI